MLRLIENIIRSAVNETVDKAITRLIKDQYTENLFEMIPSSRKVGVMNLMEIAMRANQGTPVSRPLGSPLHMSPWEKLLFNPVHLFRFPTPENVGIDTSVTIGSRSKRPMTISIPIMIAAMSFSGALSKNAKIALAKAASAIGQRQTPAGREDALIHSRLPGVNSKEDFIKLVKKLRDETGVPIGLKIAATHHLEKELQIAVEAEVDFVTIDGAEGGTHGGAPTLQDDVGLPTLFAITRAVDFFKTKGVFGLTNLIATGGLVTPGQMLKAIALGADAVYIGTAAIMALVSEQMVKSVPFEPPTSLVVYTGKMTNWQDNATFQDKGVLKEYTTTEV